MSESSSNHDCPRACRPEHSFTGPQKVVRMCPRSLLLAAWTASLSPGICVRYMSCSDLPSLNLSPASPPCLRPATSYSQRKQVSRASPFSVITGVTATQPDFCANSLLSHSLLGQVPQLLVQLGSLPLRCCQLYGHLHGMAWMNKFWF